MKTTQLQAKLRRPFLYIASIVISAYGAVLYAEHTTRIEYDVIVSNEQMLSASQAILIETSINCINEAGKRQPCDDDSIYSVVVEPRGNIGNSRDHNNLHINLLKDQKLIAEQITPGTNRKEGNFEYTLLTPTHNKPGHDYDSDFLSTEFYISCDDEQECKRDYRYNHTLHNIENKATLAFFVYLTDLSGDKTFLCGGFNWRYGNDHGVPLRVNDVAAKCEIDEYYFNNQMHATIYVTPYL